MKLTDEEAEALVREYMANFEGKVQTQEYLDLIETSFREGVKRCLIKIIEKEASTKSTTNQGSP
jgi:hypothetical protein